MAEQTQGPAGVSLQPYQFEVLHRVGTECRRPFYLTLKKEGDVNGSLKFSNLVVCGCVAG